MVATRDVTGSRLDEAGDPALRRIALAIAERRELGDVLDLVAEEAVGLLGGDQAVVLRPEDGERAGRAGGDLWPPPTPSSGEAAARGRDTGRAVYLDDLDEHADDDDARGRVPAAPGRRHAMARGRTGPGASAGAGAAAARPAAGVIGRSRASRTGAARGGQRRVPRHAFQLARTDELTA